MKTNKDNKQSFEKITSTRKEILLSDGFKFSDIPTNTKIKVNDIDYLENNLYTDDGKYKVVFSDNFGNIKEYNIQILHYKPKKDKSYIASNLAIGLLTLIFCALLLAFIIIWFKQRKGLIFRKTKVKGNPLDNQDNLSDIKPIENTAVSEIENKIANEIEALKELQDLNNENNMKGDDK